MKKLFKLYTTMFKNETIIIVADFVFFGWFKILLNENRCFSLSHIFHNIFLFIHKNKFTNTLTIAGWWAINLTYFYALLILNLILNVFFSSSVYHVIQELILPHATRATFQYNLSLSHVFTWFHLKFFGLIIFIIIIISLSYDLCFER